MGKFLFIADDLRFAYSSDEPILRGVSLKIRRGQTLGLLGCNESGKTTVAKLILGKIKPNDGRLDFDDPTKEAPESSERSRESDMNWSIFLLKSLGCSVAFFAICESFQNYGHRAMLGDTGYIAAVLVLGTLFQLIASEMFKQILGTTAQKARETRKSKCAVRFMTSEDSPGYRLKGSLKLYEVIGEHLPMGWKGADGTGRTAKELSQTLLEFCGFQMYVDGKAVGTVAQYISDGVQMDQLSGGQKHLIYLLGVLVSMEQSQEFGLLICDEILCGLDMKTQARVLHLIQISQRRIGFSVLYMTCELGPLQIIADDLAFLSRKGRILEAGEASAVLNRPASEEFKKYVRACMDMFKGGDPAWAIKDELRKIPSDLLLHLWRTNSKRDPKKVDKVKKTM